MSARPDGPYALPHWDGLCDADRPSAPGSVRTLCSLAAVTSATAGQMTIDKVTNDQVTTDRVGTTTGGACGREFAEQYWTTIARTADLVRRLTSLADSYDAAIRDGDVPSADSRLRVALIRTKAESARRLIQSLALPGLRRASTTYLASLSERVDRGRDREVRASGRVRATRRGTRTSSGRAARSRPVPAPRRRTIGPMARRPPRRTDEP